MRTLLAAVLLASCSLTSRAGVEECKKEFGSMYRNGESSKKMLQIWGKEKLGIEDVVPKVFFKIQSAWNELCEVGVSSTTKGFEDCGEKILDDCLKKQVYGVYYANRKALAEGVLARLGDGEVTSLRTVGSTETFRDFMSLNGSDISGDLLDKVGKRQSEITNFQLRMESNLAIAKKWKEAGPNEEQVRTQLTAEGQWFEAESGKAFDLRGAAAKNSAAAGSGVDVSTAAALKVVQMEADDPSPGAKYRPFYVPQDTVVERKPEGSPFILSRTAVTEEGIVSTVTYGSASFEIVRDAVVSTMTNISTVDTAHLASFTPGFARALVSRIVLTSDSHPTEPKAIMSADETGLIHVFPNSYKAKYSDDQIYTSLLHEMGHVWSFKRWGTDTGNDNWKDWREAIAADPAHASHYATEHVREDLAETFAAYVSTKQNNLDKFEQYRKVMPRRFQILKDAGL
jgi:hypothetical protein